MEAWRKLRPFTLWYWEIHVYKVWLVAYLTTYVCKVTGDMPDMVVMRFPWETMRMRYIKTPNAIGYLFPANHHKTPRYATHVD